MSKVTKYIPITIFMFFLLSCMAFPSGRAEEPGGKQETRVFWVLDATMSRESAEMFLDRYLLPTSLATMLWTEFTRQDQEVRFDTLVGYRVLRKQSVLADPIGAYTVYGYDLIIDVSRSAKAAGSQALQRSPASYTVQFSYPPSTAVESRVMPQPLEQALLAGIRKDGRSSGLARVESIDYLGSGKFKATVLVGE
ncbi:MAG: hypothetical protein JSV89_19545 [Spirochaetaceae bacterium]|nr:MAG: hypothetical protein JSV89_19545 [Spirochaetaceae bacterium]